MTPEKVIRSFVCGILFITLSACANLITSAVESSIVLAVAYHDQTVEKKQKKYTATHKCIIPDQPDPYILGLEIAYGQPLTTQYSIILSRTGEAIEPVEPHRLAYAFFLIAYKIHDVRAKSRIAWMERYMAPADVEEVRDIIQSKYLSSHLEKCFSTPDEYRTTKTTRQLVLEEQERIKELNQ